MSDTIYTGNIALPTYSTPLANINGRPIVIDKVWYKYLTDTYRNTRIGTTAKNGLLSNTNFEESGTTVTLKVGSTFVVAGTMNITGTWRISGTQVDITAAQLNALDNLDETPVDGAILIGDSVTNKYDTNTLTAGTNIGITNTPGSITINQSLLYVTKSANYTITTSDYFIEADTKDITITLPTAVSIQGRTFYIINSSTGVIEVDTTSSQTINGELTQTIPCDSTMAVVSDNTNWRII